LGFIARTRLHAGNATAGRDPRSPAFDRGQFAATARDFFVAIKYRHY
jgi:hypothetical protein